VTVSHPNLLMRSVVTFTSLLTFLDLLTPVVSGQRQGELPDASDHVSHNMLLHQLNSFGFSNAYVSWVSQLLNQQKISGSCF
jgi:hypothetical protein